MPKPLTQNPALRDVVYQNQWRDVFDGTVPEGWEPTLKVSVVTAAYNSATLDLTLASLAAQDYPEHLLEAIVVDDGSDVPVEIGKFAPKNTRLIRVGEDQGWGRSNALRIGIDAAEGDIIYWVDSDMVLFPDNVREHAKWAHFIPEAATIGHKGFVEAWTFTAEEVYDAVRSGLDPRLLRPQHAAPPLVAGHLRPHRRPQHLIGPQLQHPHGRVRDGDQGGLRPDPGPGPRPAPR